VAYIAAALAVVDPAKASEAVKQFRGLLFPEEGYDELAYIKKSQELFEKLRKVDLSGFTIPK
jgi:hypothetical protein